MAVDARQLKPAMMILLCVTTSARAEPGDDSLPPPPEARAVNDEAVFQLGLIVNHYDTGLVVPVTQRKGAYFVSSADLLRAGLPPGMCRPARWISHRLLRFAWSTTAPDSVCCSACPRMGGLPGDLLWRANRAKQTPLWARGAAELRSYTNHTEHVGGQLLWHEFRYFNERGSLSSTGYVRKNFAGDDGQQAGYVRYDTTLLVTNEEDATTDGRGCDQRCPELELQRAYGWDKLRA